MLSQYFWVLLISVLLSTTCLDRVPVAQCYQTSPFTNGWLGCPIIEGELDKTYHKLNYLFRVWFRVLNFWSFLSGGLNFCLTMGIYKYPKMLVFGNRFYRFKESKSEPRNRTRHGTSDIPIFYQRVHLKFLFSNVSFFQLPYYYSILSYFPTSWSYVTLGPFNDFFQVPMFI